MSRERNRFNERASEALRNRSMLAAVQATATKKQQDRLSAWSKLHHLDDLRDLAAAIKRHTFDHLNEYLAQFVERVRATGGRVHMAETRDDAVRIVTQIARDSRARLCVRAKSMTGQEIRLREALEQAGLRVVDTDLGEYIAQLDRDAPSHIVAPIIHKNRRDIARALQRETHCRYTEDPAELAAIAHEHLREVFRTCDVGVSGVNFAVAETGTLCICTNEGNGRYIAGRPRVHVALMGLEKLVPRLADLSVFLKLLARSSTGQPLTVYTSLITGPRRAGEPDGPQELHVVVVDAGRSSILRSEFRDALACIRCGACLNVCPVYRNVGGHAYGSTYPGPIGQVISPLLRVGEACHELPHASSLCGACLEACPVKIDIPRMLIAHRRRQVERGQVAWTKAVAYRAVFAAMRSASTFRMGQRLLRMFLRWRSRNGWVNHLPRPVGGWTDLRDLPVPPRDTFRAWWAKEHPDE